MKLIVDIPDTQYNNIMEVKSMCLGRLPYKGIVMNAINGIKKGTPYTEFGTYTDGYMKGLDVLDKIRAEIKKASVEKPYDGQAFGGEQMVRTQDVLDIIYKYMEGVRDHGHTERD